ncbi:hypothetical protein [Profundibacterium mesophilum]|uniref:Uncharacterized protein n=1 Tax=Profundibacterium mesophilum KAUST100406-0324 TaxID=1037889 RepID=A0A921NNF0_9RHOB|nr:hypothetical protein [Profundibacterium mesophilum]KAF0674886.1 hypothetical protein PMES_02768 [Profundibacterium mesophilum KAUST100406-0324]
MSHTPIARDFARERQLERWRGYGYLFGTFCIIVGSTIAVAAIVGPPMQERRAAAQHYCGQIAAQVVTGDLALGHYMATDCPLTTLEAIEALDL